MVLTRSPRRWMALVAALGATTLVTAGCSGGPSEPKPLPEQSVRETVNPGTHSSVRREALSAYRAMWGDLAQASKTSDPSSKRLDDHAEGGALQLMKYGLRSSQKDKLVGKGTPRPHPEVISAKSGKVVIRDCVDGTDWLLYKRNGEPEDNNPGSHFKADATVKRSKGTWKVSDLYMHEAGSC
ncbi:hypothetical protein [Streptomyces sp. AA1529]|uniref:hypothetical protein n=1 Tax=Streptomyces sp. AA1529 TaxID=1203257 RepID=UPI001ED93947|nr:hypothetical protein [Streptomyces sp. AA1529]